MGAFKAEKEKRRFRRLRQIGRLLRCIEASAAILLLSYFSDHISAAAQSSGIFLRRATAFLIDPRFVFLLGNAIVLVLLKSLRISSQISTMSGQIPSIPPVLMSEAAEAEAAEAAEAEAAEAAEAEAAEVEAAAEEEVKPKKAACRRCRYEKFARRRPQAKLRRAETDCARKGLNTPSAQEEEADAEEFRRRIDDFIAKHRRFRREESLAIVAL